MVLQFQSIRTYLLLVFLTTTQSIPINTIRGLTSSATIPKIITLPTTGENRSTERKPWLVFSSAGDHSAIAQWLPGREYDIMVSYYGSNPESFPCK